MAAETNTLKAAAVGASTSGAEALTDFAATPPPDLQLENRFAVARRLSTKIDAEAPGPPPAYTCPDCNGILISVSEGNYRCHVGHAWTANALLHSRDDENASALRIAIGSLQEAYTKSGHFDG